MIDYAKIISVNYPNAKWVLNGNSYDGLEWLDEAPKPTEEELDALWEPTQAQIEADKIASETAKQVAQAKLAKLGLTPDDLKALLG